MKTFKQFNEEASHITPKQFDVVPSDIRFIRTPDVIKKENIAYKRPYQGLGLENAKYIINRVLNKDKKVDQPFKLEDFS